MSGDFRRARGLRFFAFGLSASASSFPRRPLTDDETVIRHTFERTRELFDEIVSERICGPQFNELSIGMSSDFEIAIEYGATFVRIGSALYEGLELAPQTTTAE